MKNIFHLLSPKQKILERYTQPAMKFFLLILTTSSLSLLSDVHIHMKCEGTHIQESVDHTYILD